MVYMVHPSEQALIDFLSKGAESTQTETDDDKRTAVGTTNVYPEPSDVPIRHADPVNFSDAVQDSSKDVRSGVSERVLSSKPSVDAAERALLGAVLTTRDFETSNISLKPVEKVSHVRSQTLLEQTRSLLGRA